MTEKLDFHPAADAFPLMTVKEFASLCEDLRANGLREAIWLHEGQIIDGRNRYNACLETGIKPRFRDWDGKGSLVAFVVSLNLSRRHLNEAQRAMVAATLANLERGRPHENKNPSIDGNISQTAAAEMLSVSTASVERASKVLKNGVTTLIDAVEAGEMSVSQAAQIASQPKTKQKRILARSGKNKISTLASNIGVTKVLKTAKSTHDLCLLCNPTKKTEIDEDDFLAFMEVLATKVPGKYKRYIDAAIDEILELGLAGEIKADYDLILEAIDRGFTTESEILKFVRGFSNISMEILRYEMSCMSGVIESVSQGGKTSGARGQTKKIWRRKQIKIKKAENPVEEEELALY